MSDIHLSQQLVFHSVKPYQVAVRALPSRLDIQPQVDLRPTINVLSLAVRNQNSRGTCSVFALTFLLEYLYGTRLALPVNDLSEEYLNYVANLVSGNNGDGDFFQNLNAGYQAWGIVPERDLPYQSTPVTTVAQAILDAGRLWTRFEADFIKPWDSGKGASQQQLDQAIAYLNKNIPVAFGGWWFKAGNWSTTLIKDVEVMDVPPVSQKNVVVEDGHSVALVGYLTCCTSPAATRESSEAVLPFVHERARIPADVRVHVGDEDFRERPLIQDRAGVVLSATGSLGTRRRLVYRDDLQSG